MMNESSFKRIVRKTGRKPISCKCESCRSQCRTPCLGTPEDIMKLINAGYVDRLKPTMWLTGMALGKLPYPIPMVQAEVMENGWCTFRRDDGLCELHDLGLKPTEGKLSHHTITKENYNFSRGLSYQVAKEWLEPKNEALITQITGYYGEGS